jgi:hypothetical protein
VKQKMNLRQELDLTRDGTAEMTRWCIIIALHQCFGVGKDRMNRIELRAEELGLESLNIAMQANGKGMPSTDQSRAMRDNWMPEGVEPEFRVPVLRAPRTRREQQLRMAGRQYGMDLIRKDVHGAVGIWCRAAEPIEAGGSCQLPAGE